MFEISTAGNHPKYLVECDEPLPRGVYRVPDTGKFVQGLQDVLSGEWFDQNGRPCPRAVTRRYKQPPYDGLPSTVQLWGAIKIDEFFPLNEAWQFFWRDLIDEATEHTLSKEWLPFSQLQPCHLNYWWAYATQHSLALTDNHAALYHGEVIPGGAADYVLRLNLDSKLPISIKSLSMSGNIFKVIGETRDNYIVETLNAGSLSAAGKLIPAQPPSIADVWGKHWLIHWGVESTTNKLPNGLFVQSSFPPRPYGLPFPLMGIDGKNLIAKSRVRAIKNGNTWSPYYP